MPKLSSVRLALPLAPLSLPTPPIAPGLESARVGLPALPPEAARRARHKFEMKQALAHLDNLVPRHARVRSRRDLESALSHVGLPAVLKPVGASGSKGIFELRHEIVFDPS